MNVILDEAGTFEHDRELLKLLEESKSLQLDLHSYFQGSLDYERLRELGWEQNDHIILKADIQMHIDANQDWINSNLKIAYQKEKVDLLESILKSLNNRGFNINAAIQWEKFKVGI